MHTNPVTLDEMRDNVIDAMSCYMQAVYAAIASADDSTGLLAATYNDMYHGFTAAQDMYEILDNLNLA